jgi:hypothetical protein
MPYGPRPGGRSSDPRSSMPMLSKQGLPMSEARKLWLKVNTNLGGSASKEDMLSHQYGEEY